MLTKDEILLSLKNGNKAETYAAMVNGLIRQRFPLSAELAILRQKEEKPEEFAAFHAYAEACKAEARARLAEWEATI